MHGTNAAPETVHSGSATLAICCRNLHDALKDTAKALYDAIKPLLQLPDERGCTRIGRAFGALQLLLELQTKRGRLVGYEQVRKGSRDAAGHSFRKLQSTPMTKGPAHGFFFLLLCCAHRDDSGSLYSRTPILENWHGGLETPWKNQTKKTAKTTKTPKQQTQQKSTTGFPAKRCVSVLPPTNYKKSKTPALRWSPQ